MFILFMYLWRKYFVDIPNTTLFSEVKVNNVFYKKCYMEKRFAVKCIFYKRIYLFYLGNELIIF